MGRIIRNHWLERDGGALLVAPVLKADSSPEGIELVRVRARKRGQFALDPQVPHLVSAVRGRAAVRAAGAELILQEHTHAYLPGGNALELSEDAELVVVAGASARQAAGATPIVRSERFLRGCARRKSLRRVLTPQYLSRRIFLHHDPVMLSKTGDPLSWFRTTMFGVQGLPTNEEGIPVFKMSYNYRTEPNLCYDVQGKARVRLARHPYLPQGQVWEPWQPLDNETTYHLDESPQQVEWVGSGNDKKPRRNKHEVHIDGSVTLFCAFDPAPTGAEKHRPGDYSDYGPLEEVLGTPESEQRLALHRELDPIVDALSWSEACGERPEVAHPKFFATFQKGLDEQRRLETALLERLIEEKSPRAEIVRRWMVPA